MTGPMMGWPLFNLQGGGGLDMVEEEKLNGLYHN